MKNLPAGTYCEMATRVALLQESGQAEAAWQTACAFLDLHPMHLQALQFVVRLAYLQGRSEHADGFQGRWKELTTTSGLNPGQGFDPLLDFLRG
jgi:hypothetical protein